MTHDNLKNPLQLTTVRLGTTPLPSYIRTFANDILDIPDDTYSSILTGLVLQCLAYDPDLRPSIEDIMATMQTALMFTMSQTLTRSLRALLLPSGAMQLN